LKANQQAHHAVVDVDVGSRDLQQCADAAIRLRAEYLRATARDDELCFRFTNGDDASWSSWREGARPRPRARGVLWQRGRPEPDDYASFRRYLEMVFTYAGSASLGRDTTALSEPRDAAPGDVFVQAGFPGHAVVVVDAAEAADGRRALLLAQSFMPAQEVHVLRNPAAPDDPWFVVASGAPLVTPEWTFPAGSLRRFSGRSCGPPPAR
jgi:hypothetical protein